MARKESIKDRIWPALSFTLLFAFVNLFLYIFLAFKPGFPIYAVMIIANLFLTTVFLFLERSGITEELWKKWKFYPIWLHKVISALCLFWVIYLSLKALIPALKKDYEEN